MPSPQDSVANPQLQLPVSTQVNAGPCPGQVWAVILGISATLCSLPQLSDTGRSGEGKGATSRGGTRLASSESKADFVSAFNSPL